MDFLVAGCYHKHELCPELLRFLCVCNDVRPISPEASKVLDPANQLRECAQMWHAHSGMNIVDPRAELAVRTGHGGLEIRNVRPPFFALSPARPSQSANHASSTRAELRGRLAGGVHARV